MGGSVRKQFRTVGGFPLVVHALRVLQSSPIIDGIVLAVPATDLHYCRTDIVEACGFTKVLHVVAGGQERQDSVRQALAVVDDRVDIVVIHDAVRPCVTELMVKQVVEAAKAEGAAIIAAHAGYSETGRTGWSHRADDRPETAVVGSDAAGLPSGLAGRRASQSARGRTCCHG